MEKQCSMAIKIMASDMTDANNDQDNGPVDDVTLMASIANGDRNAFQLFLSRHIFAVVQFVKRYLSNRADAEDIAQETFLRVWQKAATWQAKGYSPRSWLYRIAYNLSVDEIRRRPENEHIDSNDIEIKSNHKSDSPETAFEKTSDLNRLTHLLKQLPERQRTALSLCALQGLTNKEAAIAMDISVDALESLLSRGRRQLRSQLQQDGENSYE